MIEPFVCHRSGGRVTNDLTPEAGVRALAVCQ
jgi:hypothetical protein